MNRIIWNFNFRKLLKQYKNHCVHLYLVECELVMYIYFILCKKFLMLAIIILEIWNSIKNPQIFPLSIKVIFKFSVYNKRFQIGCNCLY